MNKTRSGIQTVVWTLLGLLAAGAVLLYACVLLAMASPEAPQAADCIIVPGAKVVGDAPSRSLQSRLDRAVALYHAGMGEAVIVCGGQGHNEARSEASVMRDYLVQAGIPQERIVVEDQSLNTRENLRFARRLMQAHGWQSAVIATSDFHAARTLATARQEGLTEVSIAKARYTWPGIYAAVLREGLSWVKFWMQSAGIWGK